MTDDRGSIARLAPLVLGAVLVALLAAGATGSLPIGDAEPDGDAVLDRVEQRYNSAETVVGDATVTAENATRTKTKSISFAFADPNMSRVEVTHNESEYVVGTNGAVAWAHDVSNDTVYVRKVSHGNHTASSDSANHTASPQHANTTAPAHANVSRFLEENVTAELRRTTTLEGSEVYVLALEPTNESISGNATLWVDTDDYRVHELRTTRGENRTTVEFADVRFNESVHESTFQPPGNATDVTVVSRERYDSFDAVQADTDIALQRLDGEYAFDHAVVVTRNGRTVTLQEYAGGATNVTLAATADDLPYALDNGTAVTVAGENATFVSLDERNAVGWTDDGVTRAVVADLPRSDLVDLATDVRG